MRWDVSSGRSLFQNSGQSLKVLELLGPDFDEPEDYPVLLDIAEYCQSITTLSILGEEITKDLDAAIEKCKYMYTLKLELCTNITENNVRAICSADNLEQFVLSSCCVAITDPTIRSEKLQTLTLISTKLNGKSLFDLCACFPQLKHLSIQPVSPEDLCQISKLCPFVRTTYMGLDDTFTTAHARLLCQQWRQLELLQLQIYGSVPTCSEETLLILLQGCPHLQKLSVCRLDYRHHSGRLYHSTSNNAKIDLPRTM